MQKPCGRLPPQGFCIHCSSRRSEEHTSELQSRQYLVCRLLLEKKKQRLPSATARTSRFTLAHVSSTTTATSSTTCTSSSKPTLSHKTTPMTLHRPRWSLTRNRI